MWFLFLFTSESVLFSPTLTPPSSPRMAGLVRQGWPPLCHCTSSCMWKVCLQSASVPPSSHLPINFLWNAKVPSFVMWERLYATSFPNWDSSWSFYADLPLTQSPLLFQSMSCNWFLSLYFSCLSLSHKTGGNLAPSSLALYHFLNQSSVTFGHIWFESQMHKLIFAWFPNFNWVLVVLVSP